MKKALWGVGAGGEQGRVLSHTQSQVCPEGHLVWLPWGAGECVHSRVTGFSVFVWPMIPGMYVGFSFLARARGRGRERERRRS